MNQQADQPINTVNNATMWRLAWFLLNVRAFDPFQTAELYHTSEVKEAIGAHELHAATQTWLTRPVVNVPTWQADRCILCTSSPAAPHSDVCVPCLASVQAPARWSA